MQARRQRRGQLGRRETPDNKVPQANRETRGNRVMPAERAKRAVKGKRAETEIRDAPEIRDGPEIRDERAIRDEREIRGVPATKDEKARTHRVQPENIAIQIPIPEKPVALETTDLPGNCRFQVQTSKEPSQRSTVTLVTVDCRVPRVARRPIRCRSETFLR
jgi:hypothetical protein